jgi:hypothetical protein
VVRPPEFRVQVASAVSIPATEVAPELSDGVRIEQQIFLDNRIQRSTMDAPLVVCVDLTFVTYQRENQGAVQVVLTSGRTTERFQIDVEDIVDWGTETFCANISGSRLLTEPLTVAVAGIGAEPGAAVSVLRSSRSAVTGDRLTFPAATFREGADGLSISLPAPLGLTASVGTWAELEAPSLHPLARAESALILGIPMVVAVLVILLIALDLRRPPGRARDAASPSARRA